MVFALLGQGESEYCYSSSLSNCYLLVSSKYWDLPATERKQMKVIANFVQMYVSYFEFRKVMICLPY